MGERFGTTGDDVRPPAVTPVGGAPADRWLPPAVLAAAALLWWFSVGRIDLDAVGSTGLVGVLPLTYVAALLLPAVLFGVELARPAPRSVVLAGAVAALVVFVFGVPAAVDGTAMTPAGYVHAGFIEQIDRNHEVLKNYDARFDWPAFFAAGAVLVRLAGMPDALGLLGWAAVAFELLALAPVLLIARCLLGPGRRAWVAVVLYYAGNWFSQDYFAPQAASHLLYLTAVAALLWAGHRRRAGSADGADGPDDRAAVAVQVAVTVLCAAMVVTHQLTPIGFIMQLAALAVFGLTRYRALWLVTLLLFVLWFSYGAEDFWRGHLAGLIDNLGQVDSSVDRGLTSRVSDGDPTYLRMQLLRTAWSGLFLAVGALGGLALLLRRQFRTAVTAGVLALCPFLLIGLQSYGGEIFLRCFLYAMPFLAVLCAVALAEPVRWAEARAAGRAGRHGRHGSLGPLSGHGAVVATGVAAVVLVSSLGLVTARGVNMSFERVAPDSLAAGRMVAGEAGRARKVAVVESFAPLGFSRIDVQRSGPLGEDCETRLAACARTTRPDLILLTLEQEKYGQLRMRLPEGWLMGAGLRELTGAGYRVVFRRPGAAVLERIPGAAQ